MCLVYLRLILGMTDVCRMVQQQGLDSQTFPGESGGLAQRFAQSVGPEDLTTVFPSVPSFFWVLNRGTKSDALPSQ